MAAHGILFMHPIIRIERGLFFPFVFFFIVPVPFILTFFDNASCKWMAECLHSARMSRLRFLSF